MAIVAGSCRLLGVDAASAFYGWVWRTLAPFNRRHARALENLTHAFPDKTEAERRAIALGAWENLGRVMAEGFLLDRLAADASRFEDHAIADFAALKGDGRGLVVVSAHFGNWEFGAEGVRRSGFRPAGIYKALRNPIVDAMLRHIRIGFYPGGLLPRGADAPRRLISHVRGGGAMVILADLRDGGGVDVPFFGRPARSTPFPALVARLLGAPLMAGRVTRLKGARFRLDCEPIEVPRTNDRDADVRAATEAMMAVFERWIRETPEQWMWGMRRWR
ncbi:lipid A biosynthesis lauroyl acyltransferase [Methylopila jiangsuensis]|uniref:Lipid A biosynthesis lauroyl acyltransferase n=1 Tax=Methylopila jiangsuensis TaxID=586230 RepID=A0A9W6JEY1_9HYPH|nr:lauroyl acyltransferase [Methylopila jiangsuensis]MDR6286000.1 KDO2-lipid IV(A) lauroyltransferase [Methylopila jiangsuensis]GLK75757.1 lipid A biosynthesis lauroyl acyltransferase [Methylopila jiangsuensis]